MRERPRGDEETERTRSASGGAVLSVLLEDRPHRRAEVLGLAVARARGLPLHLLKPSLKAEEAGQELAADYLDEHHEVARQIRQLSGAGVAVTGDVERGDDVAAIVTREAAEMDAEMVVLDVPPEVGVGTNVRSDFVERLVSSFERDVVTVSGLGGIEAVDSIVVGVSGSPDSALAVDVAGALAATNGSPISLVHVVSPDADEAARARGRELLEAARDHLPADADCETRLVEAASPHDGLVELAGEHDVTVIGGPRSSHFHRLIFGSETAAIRTEAPGPIVTAWQGTTTDHWFGGSEVL